MKKSSMAERVSSLDEKRRQAPAFAPGPTKKAKRAPSSAARPQQIVVGNFVNTTMRVTEAQRNALVEAASRRVLEGEHARHDYGRVLRDVLDYWLENSQLVDRWIRERGGKEVKHR